MSAVNGFELVREQEISEYKTRAKVYRHLKTGAELLSMENDDENKAFGITFRTPPADSTGLPHILEHAVLGGSRKYQAKEPFVELIKGSLYTFINAITFGDHTSYPVASTNTQDFYNLVDVYLDAVFHPLITPHHLAQEGWHYELNRLDDPLIYKGVVFNEMKGAYSSPDGLLGRTTMQRLFPNNVYGLDSGGDPKVMPELTYEQFKQFHQTYYHPSNALIYFYGDDDPARRLEMLEGYLANFERAEVDSAVSFHPPFPEPQRHIVPYAVDPGTDGSKKGFTHMAWALPETADPELVWGFSTLSYAIVGTQASPLRKALLDSGLGEDLTGSGLSTRAKQMTFSVGMKGMNTADSAKVESLILATLEKLATEGIEPEMVEAAVNSIEFSLRENNTGSFPRGLSLMFRALGNWIYGLDPLVPVQFEKALTAIKTNIANPDYLPGLIRTHLLNNPHRVTILLQPDADLRQQEETAEKDKLAAIKANLSNVELQQIMAETAELKRRQETPDTLENLAAIPRLTLADLEQQIRAIPSEEAVFQNGRILHHDLFTNGILYLDIAFDFHTVPADLLPYLSLFLSCLVQIGTEKEDYVKLSQRIGRKTGGIWGSSLVSSMRKFEPQIYTDGTDQTRENPPHLRLSASHFSPPTAARLLLRGKSTLPQLPDLLAIMQDILLTIRLDNRDRFRQIVLKAKAAKESGLVPGGNSVVATRLHAYFNEADWVAEQMGGLNYLFFLRQVAQDIETDWPGVLQKLEQVRGLVINQNNFLCNVTLDAANYAQIRPQLEQFLSALPAHPTQPAEWNPALVPQHEGLTIPAQVNYVGKAANLYDLGYQLHGSISVITRYLRTTWLWDKVRVQGGAYGASCSFDRDSGVLTYTSYRDPNLASTLEAYDQSGSFLRQLDLPQDELVRSIIGTIGAMDGYQLPDAKGYTSLVRHLIGITDADRQQYRDEVLSTTLAAFKAFADVLDQVAAQGQVVVMGAVEGITAVNTANWLKVTKVL